MKNLRIFSIQKTKYGILAILSLLALVGFLLNLCLGPVTLGLKEVVLSLLGKEQGTIASQIVMFARLPRACGCILAGGALAVSGAMIQSILANPLAAPNIIGVNSGAGMMVALFNSIIPLISADLMVKAVQLTPVAAFLGALFGVLLVLFIAEKTGASKMTLVLAGVAVSSMFGAVIDAIVTFDNNALMGYTDFRIGGLRNLTMAKITPAFVVILVVMILVMTLANEMDIMMLGSETAKSLGLPVKKLRILLLALAAALAGAAVSIAGLLGFVGLIVPHIMRKLVGEESRMLLPASFLGGIIMLSFCDLLSRMLFKPYELPVGIVLSLIGGPFFLWLLIRQRGGRHGGM